MSTKTDAMASPATPPARAFHKLRSRRREEADEARVASGPPPHVGGYGLSAINITVTRKRTGLKRRFNIMSPVLN